MAHSQKPAKGFSEYSYEISPCWWPRYIFFYEQKTIARYSKVVKLLKLSRCSKDEMWYTTNTVYAADSLIIYLVSIKYITDTFC